MHRRSHRRSRARAATPPSWTLQAAALAALLVLLFAAQPARSEAPAPLGAASCTGCHAPAARGTLIPAIDGRPANEIAALLHDFRAGKRPATVMDRITKGFSTAELDAIASWYAESKR